MFNFDYVTNEDKTEHNPKLEALDREKQTHC